PPPDGDGVPDAFREVTYDYQTGPPNAPVTRRAFGFPGHAFQPSGEMTESINSSRQRVPLYVGVLPDQAEGDRFPDGADSAAWLTTPLRFDTNIQATLLYDPVTGAEPA